MPEIEPNRHERRRAKVLARVERNDENGGDPAYNAKDTREYVGRVSEMTIWRWTRKHDFPPPDIIIDKRRFWRRSTLDAWLDRMAAMPREAEQHTE
jgi:predicted DNA-binding transcriptional regulator AlpA